MDLLIFTEGSANEGCSDVGTAFVIKKFKNDQIWKLRSDDYSRKYLLIFSSRFSALKSDHKWILQQKTLKDLLEKQTEQKEKFYYKLFQVIEKSKEMKLMS